MSFTRRMRTAAVAAAIGALAVAPTAAHADGPAAPVATNFVARIGHVPAGLDAKVVYGDMKLWLRVPRNETVVVLDYREAPYVRFSPAGVYVNRSSEMYYLNEIPAQVPPLSLTRATPPRWKHVSDGHEYTWHDGRLHALTRIALTPGRAYVGKWSIPLLIDGRASPVTGTVWHRQRPSVVWFWPIIVLLACVLAAWRLRRPALHLRLAQSTAVAALVAIAVGATGLELYARPHVTPGQVVLECVIVAAVVLALARVLRDRPGYVLMFLIAFAALWVGGLLVPTLRDGYVLLAVPPLVGRLAAVVCLGCGGAILLLAFRLVEAADSGPFK